MGCSRARRAHTGEPAVAFQTFRKKACATGIRCHRIVGFADHKSALTATQRVSRKAPRCSAPSQAAETVSEESENQCLTVV